MLALGSCEADYGVAESTKPVYRTGDNRQWAAKNYDDTGWRTERGPIDNQLFWVRHRLTLKQWDSTNTLGVYVRAFGSFEVFWDGTLIGRNGRPASGTQVEEPGIETSYYLVPAPLAKTGPHVVALRATQAHLEPDDELGAQHQLVKLKNYQLMLRAPLIIMSFMNLIAGALLTAAIYYLFLFSNGNRKDYSILVFSVICLLGFLLLMVEYVKYYVGIPYPYFEVRLKVIGLLTLAIAWLVPLYFSIQFNLPQRGIIAGVLFVVLSGIYLPNYLDYDNTAMHLGQTMWVVSLVIVLWAVWQKARGGVLVLVGLLAGAVSYYYLYFDYSLYITFFIIVLCMLYLHAIRVRRMEQEHQAALLLSARLKLELLKKNIQPHFIKNTLTSLLDWVEESPGQGAVFIQALAREFDLLNNMAEATLIPVHQEIELCRQHLQVMQFRKEISYELEQAGIEPDDLIPPAIFHTVLENGITHSLPPADGRIRFQLSFERCDQYKKYQLLTCAPIRPAEKGGKSGSGTGFQYIAARLKESYGAGWTFHSAAVPEGWLTSITIAHAP